MSANGDGRGFEDLGFARVDHDRVRRRGFPEAIFASGKTPEQVVAIADRLVERGATNVLVTRAAEAVLALLRARFVDARIVPEAGLCVLSPRQHAPIGRVAVVAWRPEDLGVAQEAACTAEAMGSLVERRFDAPFGRPERLSAWCADLVPARAIVAVDGAGGALPSVVAGLTRSIVVAVPTSAGPTLSGVPAMLAALNSCVPGVVAVNIDNGFGAGYAAHVINAGTGAGARRSLDPVRSGAGREEER